MRLPMWENYLLGNFSPIHIFNVSNEQIFIIFIIIITRVVMREAHSNCLDLWRT